MVDCYVPLPPDVQPMVFTPASDPASALDPYYGTLEYLQSSERRGKASPPALEPTRPTRAQPRHARRAGEAARRHHRRAPLAAGGGARRRRGGGGGGRGGGHGRGARPRRWGGGGARAARRAQVAAAEPADERPAARPAAWQAAPRWRCSAEAAAQGGRAGLTPPRRGDSARAEGPEKATALGRVPRAEGMCMLLSIRRARGEAVG